MPRGWSAALAKWTEHQPPYLSAHMFSLAPLHAASRVEMLYALQRRDAREPALHPQFVRRAIAALEGTPSIALAGDALDAARSTRNEAIRALVRTAQWEIGTAFDQFRGMDPARKLAVGPDSAGDRRPP